MEDVQAKQGKNANAVFNGDFFFISTYSGYRMLGRDPKGAQHYLEPDASDETLGAAVLDALDRSRFLSIEEADDFFNLKRSQERYEEWKRSVMQRYGYKTKRALFKDMASCDIQMAGGNITLVPTNHDRLEGWGREKGDGIEDVVITEGSSAAEVGAALRVAFSRCT